MLEACNKTENLDVPFLSEPWQGASRNVNTKSLRGLKRAKGLIIPTPVITVRCILPLGASQELGSTSLVTAQNDVDWVSNGGNPGLAMAAIVDIVDKNHMAFTSKVTSPKLFNRGCVTFSRIQIFNLQQTEL